MTLISRSRRWLPLVVLVGLAVLVVAACATGTAPGGSPGASGATHAPTPVPTPLVPAQPGADPLSLLAFLFTPIFQILFMVMTGFYVLTGNIAVAIILLTLVIRTVVVPLFRRQIVSQRRMQMLQPELKEIQRRFKGDRQKVTEAQMALYKERGVSPAAGCLPAILPLIFLIPMYSVIRDGLTNYDPTAMLTVFGTQIIPLECPNPAHIVNGVVDMTKPCIDTIAFGIDWSQANTLFPLPVIGGLSILACIAAFLQLIQSRMLMPPKAENDTSSNVQRQTAAIFPLISIAYGGFLPAGLFLYWITTTIYAIVQQYLIVGWGSLFPLFGYTPPFARDHTPRFPVKPQSLSSGGTSPERKNVAPQAPRIVPTDRASSAAATVRPRERGRQGRRGRRR